MRLCGAFYFFLFLMKKSCQLSNELLLWPLSLDHIGELLNCHRPLLVGGSLGGTLIRRIRGNVWFRHLAVTLFFFFFLMKLSYRKIGNQVYFLRPLRVHHQEELLKNFQRPLLVGSSVCR